MPQDIADTTNNTPATVVESGSTSDATTTTAPNPLEEKLTQMESRLRDYDSKLTEKDNLISQYQAALGNAVQSRQPAPVDTVAVADTKFDDDSKRFVNTIVEKRINDTLRQVMLRAEAQTRLGDDPEIYNAAKAEFNALKQNPYFQGNSNELLEAMAVDRARSKVMESRLTKLREENKRTQDNTNRTESATTTQLPPTRSNLTQPNPADGDADIKAYMNNPANVEFFRKWVQNRKVDPFSDEIVREFGRDWKAKDLYRVYAERAVRKGYKIFDPVQGELLVKEGAQ